MRKHDASAMALGAWADEHGAEVRYEQNVPTGNANAEARLDLIIHHEKLKQPALIDLTIVNAAVAEYISRGRQERSQNRPSAANTLGRLSSHLSSKTMAAWVRLR